MLPPRLSTLLRSQRCASPWKRWARAQWALFSKASSRYWKNARSPPAIIKSPQSWLSGSPREVSEVLPEKAAAITVLHESESCAASRPRFFLDRRYRKNALFIRFNNRSRVSVDRPRSEMLPNLAAVPPMQGTATRTDLLG